MIQVTNTDNGSSRDQGTTSWQHLVFKRREKRQKRKYKKIKIEHYFSFTFGNCTKVSILPATVVMKHYFSNQYLHRRACVILFVRKKWEEAPYGNIWVSRKSSKLQKRAREKPLWIYEEKKRFTKAKAHYQKLLNLELRRNSKFRYW